jgi:ferrochelatase
MEPVQPLEPRPRALQDPIAASSVVHDVRIPIGILLVNLGTPDAPTPGPVRRYLREFLSDPRVLTLPAPLRWLLLNLIILPTRPRKSAAAYQQIWTDEGSPLRVHSENLSRAVGTRLGSGYSVRFAMRYGKPSIAQGLADLEADGAHRLIVLPLFPQYTSAVTASVAAEVFRCLSNENDIPAVEIMDAFYDEPDFASAWAATTSVGLEAFRADHVLFSFHGLPVDQIRKSDPQQGHCLARPDCCAKPGASLPRCYRAQCFATADGLVAALGLDAARTSTSFQSRLGNTPWIEPYTDRILGELHAKGVRRLAVLCPAFVADCLETLEEIGIRLRADWLALGGEDLWLAPCPNSDPEFAEAVAGWIRRRARVPRP